MGFAVAYFISNSV